MMWLFRAGFWLAIVSFFVPAGFAGDSLDLPFGETRLAEHEAVLDAGEAMEGWCNERPAICEAGVEAVRLGEFLADFAAERIDAALAERAIEQAQAERVQTASLD